MPNYLWNFTSSTKSGNVGQASSVTENAIVPVPALTLVGGTKGDAINVVRDYYWTYSPTSLS